MKSVLSELLLIFFLLINTSLSAHVPPLLTKGIFKQAIKGEATNYVRENGLDKIKQKFPPSKPNAPLTQTEGLSSIKEYLSNFGYLQSSAPFDDYLDKETISAIKTYQQYFNLQVTGYLTYETLGQMLLPRCAIPDMNVDYSFDNDGRSWPKAGNHWFPTSRKDNLTYGFLPVSEIPANMKQVLRDALGRWAEATAVINFTETTYDKADIKVGFYADIANEVSGESIIRLEPRSKVTSGEIRFNSHKVWMVPSENESLSWVDGILDLETVAMHQIGHLLGLDHSNDEDSVMYPYVLPWPWPQRKVELSDSDKDNIQHQYNNGNFVHSGGWGVSFTYHFVAWVCLCSSFVLGL